MAVDGFFWWREAQKLIRLLFPILKKQALRSMRGGIEELGEIGAAGISWNLVNQRAIDWAIQNTERVVAQITNTSMEAFLRYYPEWRQNGEPLQWLIDQLTPYYEPWRAELIAVTETTRSVNGGRMEGWRALGIEGKRWETARDEIVDRGDPQQLCETNQDEGAIGIDELFSSGDDMPPAHPGCRCELRPVMELERD